MTTMLELKLQRYFKTNSISLDIHEAYGEWHLAAVYGDEHIDLVTSYNKNEILHMNDEKFLFDEFTLYQIEGFLKTHGGKDLTKQRTLIEVC